MTTDSLKTRFHRDGSVTVWSASEQRWFARVTSVREADLKAMSLSERSRVLRHLRAAEIDELILVVGGRAYIAERSDTSTLFWRILLRPQQAYFQGKAFVDVVSPFAIPGAGGYSFNTIAQARKFISDTLAAGGSLRCISAELPNELRDCCDQTMS